MSEQISWKPTMKECSTVLTKLVQVDTCQPEGKEEALTDVILSMLPAKVTGRKIIHAPGRASLVVKVKGREEKGGIAFIGHIDTVACSNLDQWQDPPHAARIHGNRMYGRGTSDMKGGDAAMLLALRYLVESGKTPLRPVYFCFTADEENQGMGITGIVRDGCLDQVDEVVVCEPSDEKIGICEKGALWLSIGVQGVASHASRPDLGVNAVDHAILFANEIKAYVEDGRHHEILGETTVSITRFRGGIMTNIIPSEASIELDIRTVPGVSHEEMLQKIKEIRDEMIEKCPQIKITVDVLNNRPALETSKDCHLVQDMYQLAEEVGLSTEAKGLYFYTDASQMIPEIPVPFVIAGPGKDSLAHCVNEWISLESVAKYAQLYVYYIMKHYIL